MSNAKLITALFAVTAAAAYAYHSVDKHYRRKRAVDNATDILQFRRPITRNATELWLLQATAVLATLESVAPNETAVIEELTARIKEAQTALSN